MFIGCVIPYFQGIYIARGLRRCSSLTIRAMPQPRDVGRVTRIDSHAFLFISQSFCLMSFLGRTKEFSYAMAKISVVVLPHEKGY